ncbi:hypothetical protein OG563_03715 [Nocardia vinacea]|uniref:Uncharacterized protein n=1 Tax=Nocardia vinacea TaxID=96468 RepID=A0ABZ1Z014_9NOCA|nr:hypothetical protein [Nocardia vinacea]
MQRPAGRRFLLRSARQHFSCSARAILDRLPVVQPIPLEWPSGKIRPRCREKKQHDRPTSQTLHALFPRPRRPQANCHSESIPPFHSRVDATNAVQWYDITDDGRYAETRTTHITIRPTAPTDLAAIFTTWIDRARIRQQDTGEQFAHGTW